MEEENFDEFKVKRSRVGVEKEQEMEVSQNEASSFHG